MKTTSQYPKKFEITTYGNPIINEDYPQFNDGYDLNSEILTVNNEFEEKELFESIDYEIVKSIIKK